MTTTVLSPYVKQRFVDNNGNALYLGQLTTYQAGTLTPIATYKDSVGTVNTNPIILNARGECDLWLLPNVAYKFALTDSAGNTIPGWPIDNIVNSQLITLYGGVDTGVANAYILNFTANFTSYTDGILIYWVPSHTNTTGSTVNVNGLGVVNIVNPDGSALIAGELVVNAMVGMIYRSGSFYLTSSFGSLPLTGSFSSAPTGFTGVAPATIKYVISGNLATLTIPYINGTSNATTLTLPSLPAALQPQSRVIYPLALGMDNGANINNVLAQLDPASSIITLWKSASAGSNGWTGSGAKGLGVLIGGIFQYGNTLTYSLT